MNNQVKSFLVFFLLLSLTSSAQLLFNMGSYRNLVYTSVGYNGFFGNSTVGVARREYFKLIKKEVIGIFDVSLPISDKFFTKHVIKKGFQFTIFENKKIKIPFTFASSSIARRNSFLRYNDITAEFTINPGIYSAKYSFALDCKYELIVFRHIMYSQRYKKEIDAAVQNKWTNPLFNIFKIGIVGGLNLKRWVIYIKTGYERNPFSNKKNIPGYIVLGLGLKLGTKTMKNKPTTDLP